ncbi:hypothetical protein BJ993_003620 [Nocardioides aromaticivorans]|uniref:Calcium-binding protein n=1 Tax=Nocardioides aromaticivorans TaxID=200618 RepID=A0A7Y9ZMA8_9ACTN|nr:hypothetical protein [Nocardioides aromaticivorans]NYI46540.1 hypothetical protein [Nocardioides aromaticivorans]
MGRRLGVIILLSTALAVGFAAPSSAAVINGTSGPDTLRGTSSADEIYGHGGNDVISDGAGNDSIWGGYGADDIGIFGGLDHVWAGPGNDRLVINLTGPAVRDVVECGPGYDSVVVRYLDGGAAPILSGCEDVTYW